MILRLMYIRKKSVDQDETLEIPYYFAMSFWCMNMTIEMKILTIHISALAK